MPGIVAAPPPVAPGFTPTAPAPLAPDALVDPFSALKARLATKVAQGKQAAKIAGMQNIPPAAAPLSSSTIEKSNPTIAATDPQVRAVQQQLVSAGYKITVDGVMGPQTAAAMKAYTQAGGKLQAPPVVPQLEQGHAGAAPPPAPSFDFSQPVTSLNNVAAEKAASNSKIHAAAPDQAALEYQQMTSGENAQLGQEIAAAPKQAGPTATSAISDVSRFVVPAKPLNVDEYGNVSIDWPKFALDVAALGTNYGFGPNGVLPGAMSVPKITSLVKGSSAAVKLLKEGGSTLDALKAAKVVTSEGGNISPLLAFATPTISQAVANAPGGVVAGVQNFPKTMQQLFQSIGQGFTDYNHPAQMVMDWGMMLAATHGAAMRIHAGSQALASDGLRAAFSRPTHEGGSVFHAPPTAPRFITLPDGQQMPLLESNSHSMRLLQKLHDTLAEHFAAKFGETSKIGSYVTKRAGGFGTSARRISQPLEEAIANRLQGAVNRMVGGFTPYELRAFELTSFNTPVEVRLQQIERALSDAPDMAARIRLLHEHSLFTQIKDANITEVVRDPTGAPHVVIRQDVAPGLAAADGMVAQAGAEKDAIKIATGQMSEQGVRTRINAPGQIIRGGKYTNYSDAAKANLSESPERQAIIKALGVKESSSLIALLDSSAHGVAKEMGNPMHPEHYYSYLKQIHNVTDEMPPGALHQQLSLHDIPEFQKPLNPTEQSLRVSSITKVRANQIAKRVIAEGHDLPPSMSTAPKLGAAIKRIWDSAIPAQGQKDWYARAAKNATVVSDWYDIPEKNVVQLMAIYSQSANPSANMAFVIRAIEEFKSKGEITSMGAGGGAQRAKANAVLNGANWEGRKTNTYYNNIGQHIPSIVESGDITLGGVTVDRHATNLVAPELKGSPGKYYSGIEATYQAVAKELGWSPHEVQAASWITFKAERLIARYGMPKEQALQEAGDAYETGIDKHGAQVRMDFNDPKVYTVTDPTEADILQNHIDSRAGSNLQGLPGPIKVGGFDSRVHFKSSAAVQQIAEQFYQLPRVRHYLTVNPERGARIADWFHGAKDGSSDPAVRAAYAKFAAETLAQYHELVKAGYTFEFYPRDENGQLTDPYPNGPRHAMIDLTKNKHLFVFPDEGGTGGAADMTSAHPLAGDSGVQWNGQRVSHNELFRGVHDVFGHHKEGVGFRADGEENAFQSHRVMYSPEAQRAMASETRGQNSWVNFGPHGKANQTANQADTVYADQKAVLAPDWVINDGTPRPLHEVNPIAAWEGTIMRHAVSLGAKVTRGGISKGAAADAEQSILDFAKRNPDHPTSQAITDLYSRAVEARNSGPAEQYFQHESVPSPYHIQSAFGTAAFEAVARDASLKPVVDEATSLREEGSNAGARAAIRNATSDDARARAHLMDAYIALAHEDQARHLGSVLPQDLLKQRDMRLTGSDPRGSSGGSLDTPGPYGIKGAISFDRTGATIYTTPASDYSTWAHELLGHFNLHYEALDRRAITTLIRLSGIKPEMGAEYTSEGLRIRATKEVVNPNVHLNDLTPEQQRSVHEYFATQLESWLHQGRTKNPQLEQVMRHASKQMGDIYEAHELPALHPRVARIFDRMFKHNAPEGAGVIGGESEFAGRNYLPGHFFTARGGKGPRTMTTLVTGRAKEPMNKQPYTGAGLTTGNMPENPALLLAKGLKRDLKYMQTFRARQDLAALGRDELTPAQVAQLKSGSERWGLVNDQTGKSHVVPGWAHELMGSKEGTTVDEELLHENLGRLQALHNKLFVGKDNASAVLDPSQLSAYNEGTKVEGYKWVDRNLMGKDLKNAAQAQWGTGTFNPMRVVDAITNFEKNLIVYAKPGHLSTRILANAGFNLIHGALNGANLYRSWRMFTQLDPESRFRAMAIAGQGYTQSLIGEDVGIGARAAHAGANFYGNKIDAPWRFIALMQEARRAGYGSPEKFKELLYSNDPQVVADRNRIGIKANREAGDYARMGPTEQRVIRRIIFFYPWLKASTFFAGRALLEHPIKANLLLNLGQVGYNQEQKKLGPLDARDQGLIGFGSGAGLTTSQPSGINPYETPAQAWNTIQTILPGFLGGTPNTQAVQASGWLGPAPKALIDWALHLDPFGNAAPPAESGSQLLLNEMFTGSPEYLFAKQAYDALQGVNPNLNAAGVDRKEYPSSLLTQAERFFFGSWFSRPTNKSTANYLAMKEGAAGSGDTTKLDAYNFTQRVQAVGDPPPDPTIMQQLAYRSQLLQSIPKGSDVGHKAMIAAQFYAKITGDNSWVQRTVDEQHNPYASAAFYSALRTLIYGQYTAYNSTVVAKEKRLAFQQANAPTGG